jgi:hypothetical protein
MQLFILSLSLFTTIFGLNRPSTGVFTFLKLLYCIEYQLFTSNALCFMISMLKLTKLRCNLLSVKFIKIFLKHFKIIKSFSLTGASSTCPDRVFVPSLDIYIVAACCFLYVSRLLWLRLPLLVLRFV